MKNINKALSFLAIGKTQDSESTGGGFKRYVGIGSSFVLAVNPNKAKLDELMGFESKAEPEYVAETEKGKEARINFIVRTDPEANNGVEITNRLMFTLRNAPAYNSDQTKVQVIDDFGNHMWIPVEDAKANKPVLRADGNPAKIDTKYRMACVGECDLVDFLKAYLCAQDAFNYSNGTWSKKENAQEYVFKLENIKDYFTGNVSELREAIALQANNKVKLLYGVRTADDGKQYQVIATRGDFILRNTAGATAYAKLEQNLTNAKLNGAYSTTEFKVQELKEYAVEATNLEKPVEESGEMPWDD